MIKFEFINHSCFSLSYNNISLTVDPWLEGTVFNKSWNLLVETPEKSLDTVKNSDFIWFSHEHPDHFNPLSIKLLPLEKIYLFQKTSDRRVVKYLSNHLGNAKNEFSIQFHIEIVIPQKYKNIFSTKNIILKIIIFFRHIF